MNTKIKKLIIATFGLLILMPGVFASDYLPVAVYTVDTVAGYPARFKTSLINPNQDVRFVVEKPDGAVVQIPAQADQEGVAMTDFYGHQTKIAGKYKVALVYSGSSTSSPQTTFTVYPDQVSPSQSTLRSTLKMADAGKDAVFVVATLYDQYKNPVPNHLVKLVSSRSEDKIEPLQNGVSDNNGRANFKVTSRYPGISVFTAMDVTVSAILQAREEVVFLTPSAPATSSLFGASLFSANIGGDGEVLPGPVDYFDIEDLPSTVRLGDELSLTIVARDKNKNVAKNYTGTILISVPDDENAVLPNSGEYTFKAADQGRFTFNLSLQFSKLGKQAVQVFDKSNFKISGEKSVEVVPRQSIVPQATSPDISIKSPVDGAEFGSNTVIISGTGNENINLKMFDNDIKIGDTETDSEGFFSYEARSLADGSHTFYVMTEDNLVSRSVTVKIDTTPPVINYLESDAESPVVPGFRVTVKVQSEPGLDEAKLKIQGIEEVMTESDAEPGTYSVTFAAPAQDGVFPIDIILADKLANKAQFSNRLSVTVVSPKPNNPPVVEGLEGEPGDTYIDLSWDEVLGHERPVSKYRIYYGTQLDELNTSAETQDSKTSWQLRGLLNDSQYFIAITAIDTQGLESEEKSVMIAVTPVAPDLCEDVDCGEHGVCSEGVCECQSGWSGILCDIEDAPPEAGVSQLTVIPYDSAVTLSWPEFYGVQAYSYKVFIGVAPGIYTDYAITPNNSRTFILKDLINNAAYYFAVAALDINGRQISPLSMEVAAMPYGAGLRPAAPSPVYGDTTVLPHKLAKVPMSEKTGPESLWVIFISAVFAYFLYSHKRKLILKNR